MIRLSSALLSLLALACASHGPHGAAPSATVEQGAAPADPAGLAILRDDCLACHSEDLIRQQRLTGPQWGRTVEKMHNWGAPTESEATGTLATYLASRYARDAGPFAPEVLSADQAAALFDSLPDGPFSGGDPQRGLVLYRERCLPCHEEDGRGGPEGVNLAGVHVLDRAADFASTLRTGRGRMPSFAETTGQEAADLLAYLRGLP